MKLPRLNVAGVRAAVWALRALGRTRRTLRADGFVRPALPRVPAVDARFRYGATGALRRSKATCLESATVLQAWDAAHDAERDLIIGVTSPSSGFRAHAWLDGDPPCHDEGFSELLRRPAT